MYDMSGMDTPFLFNWGLLSYGLLCSHLLKAILMQQKKTCNDCTKKQVAEYDRRVSLLEKVRFMQWIITSCETNVRLGSVVEK